jgi:S1-C subfamily serine protease
MDFRIGVGLVLAFVASPAAAQELSSEPPPAVVAPPLDMREVHDRCVRSMVRIERPDGSFGSGFVADVGGRRAIVTNAHVAEGADSLRIVLYDGTTLIAHARYVSDRIDLAVLMTEDPLTAPALEVSDAALVRGERVVLGGNPGGLAFITTEGVVAGVVSGSLLSDAACGEGNNCVVLDTEAEPGSSGGPVVDQQGHVIGMLWGVYMGTSLSMTIHGTTLATELATAAEMLSHHGRRIAHADPRR